MVPGIGPASVRPMRFGAFVPQGWRIDLAGIDVADHWETMLGIARDIESLGYESLWVYDHFHSVRTRRSPISNHREAPIGQPHADKEEREPQRPRRLV